MSIIEFEGSWFYECMFAPHDVFSFPVCRCSLYIYNLSPPAVWHLSVLTSQIFISCPTPSLLSHQFSDPHNPPLSLGVFERVLGSLLFFIFHINKRFVFLHYFSSPPLPLFPFCLLASIAWLPHLLRILRIIILCYGKYRYLKIPRKLGIFYEWLFWFDVSSILRL